MRARLTRSLHWLVPGIGIKRWILLAVFGVILLLDAVTRWFIAEGTGIHVNEILDDIVDDYFPPAYLTWILGAIGIALVAAGVWMWLRAVVRGARDKTPRGFRDALAGRRLQQGYKIVAIGGGTGLSTLLRGLKRRTSNLTAVVTVSDDGGSSGRLQKELGVLPPGDVRNCLVALADDEAMVTDLFRYRFTEGEGLSGHSFGNLFLAAMSGITGNFDQAIKESSRVLNVVGRVLPATLGMVRLCAELDDGTIVEGESSISQAKRPIKRVFFEPATVAPLDEVVAAIRDADAIVLGPGSLFTSLAPNLLVSGIAREVADSHAVKMYVCNVMTQPGETDAMTAADHVEALLKSAGERVCDYVIVNDEPPSRLLGAYAQEGQVPVLPDVERIAALGLEPVRAGVIGETETVRHDPEKLAAVVLSIVDRTVAERATLVKPASAYRRSSAFS
ncbi:MAG TPA: gluconeogenesis factor YvcK family protein [Candidatus Dormibacteraeota bacterium]|nr:gluconeogenesis factor YvcK family protein [Candidatus Dormibacteraeota bacterium]